MMIMLDLAIASLLIVTIYYCYILNKRIAVLHKAKREMVEYTKGLMMAMKRSEDNIASLRSLLAVGDQELRKSIEQARYIANDPSFLVHKYSGLSQKIRHSLFESEDIKKTETEKDQEVNVSEDKKKAIESLLEQIASKRAVLHKIPDDHSAKIN